MSTSPAANDAGIPGTHVPTAVRPSLLMAAVLLVAGQLSYVVITQFHVGGDANDHSAIFTEYAGSGIWKAVHLGQFVAMAVLLAGLIALPFAVESRPATTRWAALFGSAAATVSLALYGVLQAVDGIALKQAVSASSSASGPDDGARFASAEAIRWLEWGVRSYHNIALGIALIVVAAVVMHAASVPRAVAALMAISGSAHVVQGWLTGADGFTTGVSTAIVAGFVLNTAWMAWLLVIARRDGRREAGNAPQGAAGVPVPTQSGGPASRDLGGPVPHA